MAKESITVHLEEERECHTCYHGLDDVDGPPHPYRMFVARRRWVSEWEKLPVPPVSP